MGRVEGWDSSVGRRKAGEKAESLRSQKGVCLKHEASDEKTIGAQLISLKRFVHKNE